MKTRSPLGRLRALAASALAGLIAACTTPPAPRGGSGSPVPPEQPGTPAQVVPGGPPRYSPAPSNARTPREYRRDAATHLYQLHRDRIFTGRLPPMLYAVGVLEVDLDAQGRPQRLHWLRAPRHAPEVMAEIERMVRAAGPYPVATRLGRVTYTDTWLWHKSGRFQLDTLTEGQD